MTDIGPFPDIFWTINSTTSRQISWRLQSDDRLNLLTHLRIVRMPSPVQSNCDAHDTIANGQYGAVWSMGHTQQVCVRIVLLPLKRLATVFGRSAFLRQQETDLPLAELWCACSFFADRTIYLSSRRRTSNMTSPCRLLHSSSFK
ncbi:hypothetical protein TNCV_3076391 [Trichonephila clavipes]|nr:hypothetical protein TNCV_3076391 [Trichonephila clavipes]